LTEYKKHPGYRDKLDIRCTTCIKERKKIVESLRKVSPPKTDQCECCGKKKVTLVLDHCSINNTFRGWICGNCNKGLGMLGDNQEGLEKAIEYLKRKRDVESI
jgi:hypothetical protein